MKSEPINNVLIGDWCAEQVDAGAQRVVDNWGRAGGGEVREVHWWSTGGSQGVGGVRGVHVGMPADRCTTMDARTGAQYWCAMLVREGMDEG